MIKFFTISIFLNYKKEVLFMKRLTFLLVIVLIFSFFLTSVALAKYPVKPVKIIVAFKAGGGTDTAARVIAKFAKKYFPKSFVIVNKPGAGGQIGFEALAFSKPDGYTIGFINTPHIISHYVSGKAKYKISDFKPICNVVTDPGVLAIRADEKRFSTLKGLVTYAKLHPGELSAATTGPGGDDSIALLLFMKQAGINIKDVPFSGSSGEKAALLGKHVDFAMVNVSQVLSLAKEGKVKMVAVMADKRLKALPDIPTFKELGYNVISDSSRGIAAPAGVSDEIINQLKEVFAKVIEDPDFIAQAKKSGLYIILNYMDSEQFSQYLKDLQERVEELYKENPW